tara:strand:- start:1619 stop:1744 length:126 start_codon:yes stop_codon:yes gene_type:complete
MVLVILFSELFKRKKSGILTHNEMDSALVGAEGFEPPTLWV